MIRQEVILQSPLRFLDREIHGGLGRGHLGVIMAPPGVGKSACLTQLGLDALLRGRTVLHVALGQSVEHVAARYDALFDELAARVDLADRRGVSEGIGHRRLIWSTREVAFDAAELERALGAFRAHLGAGPAAVLVDGFGWGEPRAAATLATLKESAARAGAELWLTAREGHGQPPHLVPLPDGCAALVDIGVLLEPHGQLAEVMLVKDFDRFPALRVPLVVEGGTLRQAPADDGGAAGRPSPEAFTLLASGSPGAEEVFGACAARWGVGEVNYTFAGRGPQGRSQGRVELSEDELEAGDVSVAYVRAHLHRTLAESPELRKVLQTIWHQVVTAGEVFAVGMLNEDGTVEGGTGWAVELARHWGKPVHVFDQERRGWLRFAGGRWTPEAPPVITHGRFAGAGTLHLSDEGRAAIRALFERTFGPA